MFPEYIEEHCLLFLKVLVLASLFSVKKTKKKKKKCFYKFFYKTGTIEAFQTSTYGNLQHYFVKLNLWYIVCLISSNRNEEDSTFSWNEVFLISFLGQKCCFSYLLSAIHILTNCFMEAVWVVKEKWFFYLWVKCNFHNGKSCLCILREGI